MISICPQCSSSHWNKTATATHITCPDCGHTWPYRQGKLYLLTGCSGVGKTTTALHLTGITKDYTVLDADMFYDPDAMCMLEQIGRLTADCNHQGMHILWAKAGGLEQLHSIYHRQFFSEVKCLALTCEPNELCRRMTEGRGITDESWLNGSQSYNAYFRSHNALGDVRFDTLDITRLSPAEAAKQVHSWMQEQIRK